jgi:spoIIIJ-associated protein
VIRVRAPDTGGASGSGERSEADEDVDLDEQADVAADFLEGLLDRIGLMAEVEITDADGATYVDIWGEDDEEGIGLLIGRRGATLEGLQELVRMVVHQQTGDRCRVLVDVEDYRKRRRSQLTKRAREVGRRLQESGGEEALEPMSAYERKLVHDAVAELGGLETQSEGEEPNRRVVIRRRT